MQKLQQGTYGTLCQIVDPLVRAGLVDMQGMELCPVVLQGNLGTGKTALAQHLTGCKAFVDPEAANPAGCTEQSRPSSGRPTVRRAVPAHQKLPLIVNLQDILL